jgi:hypothetical protein
MNALDRANNKLVAIKRTGKNPIYAAKVRPFLGFALTYAQLAWEYLTDTYGANVAANVGLTKDQIKKAVEVVAAIYQKNWQGFGRKDHQAVRDYAAGVLEWPETLKPALGKLLFLLEDIGPKQTILNDWFAGKIGPMSFINNWTANTASTAKEFAEAAKDTAKETIETIAKGAGSALKTLEENLPWFLKLKLIIPAGLLILGYLYLPKPKKRPDYKKNPISKKAVQKFEEFHDRPPKKIKSMPEIDTKNLVDLGQALEIGYKSKKWTGKNENYLHEFKKNVRLYSTDNGKHLIISGKNLNVAAEGITG